MQVGFRTGGGHQLSRSQPGTETTGRSVNRTRNKIEDFIIHFRPWHFCRKNYEVLTEYILYWRKSDVSINSTSRSKSYNVSWIFILRPLVSAPSRRRLPVRIWCKHLALPFCRNEENFEETPYWQLDMDPVLWSRNQSSVEAMHCDSPSKKDKVIVRPLRRFLRSNLYHADGQKPMAQCKNYTVLKVQLLE